MYTTGEIAAQLCLETPGLDTLDIAVFWKGIPTIASTQTILVNAAPGQGLLPRAEPVRRSGSPTPASTSLSIPASTRPALALPWGGTSHPVWFKNDPRVANVKVLGGVFNRPLMQGVPQIVAAALEARSRGCPSEQLRRAGRAAAGVMNSMPPRENPRINTSVDSVHASGPLGARALRHPRQLQLQADRPAAGLCARTSLLQQPPRRVGFASGCQAFGHRELLGVLRSFGLVHGAGADRPSLSLAVRLIDYLDKGASLGAAAVPDDGRRGPCPTPTCRAQPSGRPRTGPRPGVRPGDKVAMLSEQRSDRVRLRVRHLPRGRRLVPDQPAQRGEREPRPARPLRLRLPDLPAAFAPMVEQIAPRAAPSSRPASAWTAPEPCSAPFWAQWLRRTSSAEPLAGRAARRPRHDRRHRRHHRPAPRA